MSNRQNQELSRRHFLLAGVAAGLTSLAPAALRGQTATPPNPAPQTAPAAPGPAKKYQARPPATQPFGAEAFKPSKYTTARWLGSGGLFLNCRGTTLMLDPLLEGFDMPIMIDQPITPNQVPHLDAVLVTHADNDHYSVPTLRDLFGVCKNYHSTQYVDSLMKKEGFISHGHEIGDTFTVGPMRITLTPADHAYQNAYPHPGERHFKNEDACGFRIETPDGTIWAPGDTRLMDVHLHQPKPDCLFMDFSDNEWHFTLAGAAKVANAYPNTPILPSHWGSVDAPDFTPFNGDPKKFAALLVNPERLHVLAPGQPYRLKKLNRD